MPVFSMLLALALIQGSCGSSDNKKSENTASELVAIDSATGMEDNPELSAETALPGEIASNTTTSTVPKNAEATQAEKKEAAATPQPATNASVKPKPSAEQPKMNPVTPAKPTEASKVPSPSQPTPPPPPVVAEKPKVVEAPPAPKEPAKATQPDPDSWVVPSKDRNKPNPVKADGESLSLGKSLYVKHCASCHGKSGRGDGSKAAQLDTPSGDFTTASFKKQTDGSMFYKIMKGKDDMPKFNKKLQYEEDAWSIVNYIKTL